MKLLLSFPVYVLLSVLVWAGPPEKTGNIFYDSKMLYQHELATIQPDESYEEVALRNEARLRLDILEQFRISIGTSLILHPQLKYSRGGKGVLSEVDMIGRYGMFCDFKAKGAEMSGGVIPAGSTYRIENLRPYFGSNVETSSVGFYIDLQEDNKLASESAMEFIICIKSENLGDLPNYPDIDEVDFSYQDFLKLQKSKFSIY